MHYRCESLRPEPVPRGRESTVARVLAHFADSAASLPALLTKLLLHLKATTKKTAYRPLLPPPSRGTEAPDRRGALAGVTALGW
jgi:hypothetical protein